MSMHISTNEFEFLLQDLWKNSKNDTNISTTYIHIAKYLAMQVLKQEPKTKCLIPDSDAYLTSAVAGLSSSRIKVSTSRRNCKTNTHFNSP